MGMVRSSAINGPAMARRTLAQFLSAWLETHEMTQRQFAAELDEVSETRMSRWVTGAEVPARRYRDDLAGRLGVDRTQVDRLCANDPKAAALEDLLTIERAVQRLRATLDD
jgi:transcriptional regulator with XRE-family HTH domain